MPPIDCASFRTIITNDSNGRAANSFGSGAKSFKEGTFFPVPAVQKSEGGGPGSPEMSFLYELGINEFVQNVTSLLRDPNDQLEHDGVFAGYIDDLYWAATFDKMVEVIKFVLERGPAYGYSLNLKKSIYLMSPSTQRLSSDELHRRIRLLIDLGVPAQNIKAHPDCELGVSFLFSLS